MITAIIVDDEPLARSRMKRLLELHGVQIVAEAANGAIALQQSEDLQPDLLFLDIQMPGLTGLQMATALLHLKKAPYLVFVTGYSEHSLAAFEYGALDYLVKPVTQERLTITLTRVRERLTDQQARTRITEADLKKALPAPEFLRSLPIRADFAARFLALDKILCVFAREKKVYALTVEAEHRTFYTLTQLETLLPTDRFVRIHDSTLVNLDEVQELIYLGDHAYEVRLSNQQRLRVGRTRYPELQRRLGLDHRPIV